MPFSELIYYIFFGDVYIPLFLDDYLRSLDTTLPRFFLAVLLDPVVLNIILTN